MTHAIMRPVRETDFESILALAVQSGGGMTNLPKQPDTLRAKLRSAAVSFAKGATKPGGEFYMLALEKNGEVVGTSAVFASVGGETGFVNYKIIREFYFSVSLAKRFQRDVLIPTHDFTDCSEVGSLYLAREVQGGGLGRLLARARYLFIAQNRSIVADVVCAELRGWRAPDGAQPFWNAVGRRFFNMDFEEADGYNAAHGNQFIEDLMPRYPIYVDLLPKDARECLGKPHDDALPAMKMLTDEGFSYNQYVDIFDGGPLVDARVDDLRAVRQSRVVVIGEIANAPSGVDALIAAGAVADFRAIRAKARIEADALVIDRAAAAALAVEVGSIVRWAPW